MNKVIITITVIMTLCLVAMEKYHPEPQTAASVAADIHDQLATNTIRRYLNLTLYHPTCDELQDQFPVSGYHIESTYTTCQVVSDDNSYDIASIDYK